MTIGCFKVHLAIAICLMRLMCLTHTQTCLKETPVAHSYTFPLPFSAAPGTWRSKTRTCWSMLSLSRRAILSGMANSRCYRTLREIYVKPFESILLLSDYYRVLPPTSCSSSFINQCADHHHHHHHHHHHQHVLISILMSSTLPLNPLTDSLFFFKKRNLPGTDYSGTKLLKGFFGPDWW